jgi:hypothetical protein
MGEAYTGNPEVGTGIVVWRQDAAFHLAAGAGCIACMQDRTR